MFKNITIKNFRGIKELTIDDFKKVNLFVGANNSGKTSVLEALYISINPNNPSLAFRTDIVRELYNQEVGSSGTASSVLKPIFSENSRALFYGLNIEIPIELTADLNLKLPNNIKPQAYKLDLAIKPHLNINANFQPESFGSTSLTSEIEKLINEFSISTSTKNKKKILYVSELYQIDERGSWNVDIKPSDNYKILYGGSFIPSKLPTVHELKLKVSKTIDEKKKEQVVEVLRQIDPKIKSFDLSNGVVKIDVGLNKLIHIRSLGDGIYKIFRIIVEILGESEIENGVLLIDEIENGLHYTSQRILWNWLFKTAKEKNIQIFATTHSEDCERAFLEASKEVFEKEDEARLYRLNKKVDDTFVVAKYDTDSLDLALNKYDLETR